MTSASTIRHLGAVALAAALLTPAAAEAQRVQGSFERTLNTGERPEIDITSGSGSIEIREGGGGRVEVHGRIRAADWGWNTSGLSAEERVRRLEKSPPIEQRGNSVRIGYIDDEQLRNVSISYEIVVPAGAVIRSRSGSGSQRIEGVSAIDVSTGSGSLNLRRTNGRVRASTGSGGITAQDVGGDFDASTGSGSIDGTGIGGAITARTSSGRIEVTQTGSGDVRASSSSGSVRVRGVRGGVQASTTSGSLAVEGEMARPWKMSTSSGRVTVSLPSQQGFDLDASSSSGRIDVDFPINASGTVGRRALRGSARGGGPLLHVRTSSGGIAIH